MKREKYIKLRLNNDILLICYEFYKENTTKQLSLTDFTMVFPAFIDFAKIDFNLIKSYFDNKFNLTIVTKNDKILKIY